MTRQIRMHAKVAMAAAAMFMGAGSAHATIIQLSGDLGSQSWSGSPIPLAAGNTIVEPFTHTDATGSLTGEVHAENIGGVFSLTITNLVYEATAEGAAPDAHSIELYIAQEFFAPTGPYTAEHSFSGTADLGAGQEASVGLLTFHQFSNSLPALFDSTTGPGAAQPLADGPTTLPLTSTNTVYAIESYLMLTLSGGFATPSSITLPASAHITATLVPGPGALAVLACGALLGSRRRRD